MQIVSLSRIAAIDATSWNALDNSSNPFIKHEFLDALEQGDCVSPASGWQPVHLVAMEDDTAVGAMPLYFKSHSWGEFVFDFAWADAYERSGRAYYPKAVAAVPFTPATGPRLLVPPSTQATSIKSALLDAARELIMQVDASSFHCLFPTQEEAAYLESQGCALRIGCQYHWQNREYQNFDEFLGSFTAEKRKKVKRERRRVQEADITIRFYDGTNIDDELWRVFYRFYLDTMLRKSGHAPLNLGFFQRVGATLPHSVVMAMAYYRDQAVAAALSFRSEDTLYGRYWGASEDFHSLHFELCYYAGIDYCIQHGLKRFEPGAQGEHKISRGFLPTTTYSAHWLADPDFSRIIQQYLSREREQMRYHMAELNAHAPYKSTSP